MPSAADDALPGAEARLVALSAAIAAGDAPAIASGAEDAIREGASREALYETLLQSYLFLGFPRAIEAFFAAHPVLERHRALPAEAARPDLEGWQRQGEALCRRVYGRN